jgi:hypothetical protein
MEEAKTQENRKLQQQLQELQLQSKATKDLLKREQENAKEALEKAALVPEVQVDTTLVDKLTAENENLKVSMIDDFYVHCIRFVALVCLSTLVVKYYPNLKGEKCTMLVLTVYIKEQWLYIALHYLVRIEVHFPEHNIPTVSYAPKHLILHIVYM